MPGIAIVNAVPVIDTSGSMKTYKYDSITKSCAAAFVSQALPGDGIGVVSYDSKASITQAFAVVDQNLTQAIKAAKAIDKLGFGGKTAIGLGLQAAKKMLDFQANPRGIVLLSDGFNNVKPDPLTVRPKDYPVYSCAMGHEVDKTTMKAIADLPPKGRYYEAPFPSTMALIFNQIRGLQGNGIVQIVTNEQCDIPKNSYKLIPAPISGANMAAQFGVVWDDSAVSYVDKNNPGKSQVSITLVYPNSEIAPIYPVMVGAGYAVFDSPSPQSGVWRVQVVTGGRPLQVTLGAFEFPANSQKASHFVVSAPDSLTAGTPLSLQAHVMENGDVIDGVTVRAEVMHPTVSVVDAMAEHREALQNIPLTEEDREDGAPEERVRFARLYAELFALRDILEHRTFNVMLAPAKQGMHVAVIDTPTPGCYTVRVIANGTSAETKTAFQRTHFATVTVHPNTQGEKP